MSKALNVGDTVRFKRAFLQSTCSYTGELPRLKGTVVSVGLDGLSGYVRVDWDYIYFQTKATGVLASNLERIKQ
jgi:hypothetical protein